MASQKVMPPAFYFVILQVGHVQISQDFAITFLKAQLIFNLVSKFVDSLLSFLNKSMHSHPVEVSVPPLQPLARCIPHHWNNGVLAGFFQRTEQVINLME
jgi:hypothetical protein